MKQLFKEFLVLLIVAPICFVIFVFAMQKAEQSRQVDTLKAVIEKKELTISSPVFGSIEEFSVEEGDVITKDSTLAVIHIIDKKESSQLSSDVYLYDESAGTITVKSPVDAVVAKKELAEKSTIKPEGNLITILPLASTLIKIQTKEELQPTFYESVYLTDKQKNNKYPVIFSKKLPVSDKSGMIYYYAFFVDTNLANNFYDNQQVTIQAKKKANALTGKLDSFMSRITNSPIVKALPFN